MDCMVFCIFKFFNQKYRLADFLGICLQFMLLRYCTRACAAGILTVEMELLL